MSTRTIALPEATAHECSPQHTGPSQWTDHRLREQKGPTWIFIVLSGMIFLFSPFRNSISISGFCGLRGQSRFLFLTSICVCACVLCACMLLRACAHVGLCLRAGSMTKNAEHHKVSRKPARHRLKTHQHSL